MQLHRGHGLVCRVWVLRGPPDRTWAIFHAPTCMASQPTIKHHPTCTNAGISWHGCCLEWPCSGCCTNSSCALRFPPHHAFCKFYCGLTTPVVARHPLRQRLCLSAILRALL